MHLCTDFCQVHVLSQLTKSFCSLYFPHLRQYANALVTTTHCICIQYTQSIVKPALSLHVSSCCVWILCASINCINVQI